ncbi:MAG: PAS domain S-box protein [Acidobacteria bacterium]|nr:MAG: PAS domain S-box protein [Acidobacteriota bacterium]REK02279.1 MAG: PAS domain S-box protein [Acidobacteriota bacterium]REK13918.1 MAG: PAS domain S-box protein [Acidobacteriota bacterium]REK41912.1 MAG: PAS domain S-box protein [Acidobacteriota bacterium]
MNTEKYLPGNLSLNQKLQTLVIGRLLAVFLLLVATWVWNSGHLKLSWEDFPQGLFLVFIIAVGLTIVYFFFLRLSESYDWQIRTQFFLDAMLVTWLVWRTGVLNSPYITLYIIVISVASIFLNGKRTLIFASLCVVLFTTLAVLTSIAVIEPVDPAIELSKAIQIVAFHDVAFLVVGLLSARLAERYNSGEKLRETTRTLENLRMLHERIVESIRSGLVTIDLEGNIYTFNSMAEEITGYRASEMRGKSIYYVLGDIGREIGMALKAGAESDNIPRHEMGFTNPDGFVVQIGYSISPLTTEGGETTGLIIAFQDLTDIRSMEESVRRKDRLAAVGRVAAGLAHEIRNPLGAMRGAIQVLDAETPKDSAQSNLMEIILTESDRLNSIITNFLKYARPADANFEQLDVCEAIRDTMTLLEHSPDVRDSHVLKAELPDESIRMNGDVAQLKQIFWNLARNSLQAMPEGGEFRISLSKRRNGRLRIVFEDSGCGMPREQVEQLFEPFSNSTTGGTGLGLSIVYQIVRDHNGTISVSSKEGAGTKISLDLPCDYGKKAVSTESIPPEAVEPESRLKNYLNVQESREKVSP